MLASVPPTIPEPELDLNSDPDVDDEERQETRGRKSALNPYAGRHFAIQVPTVDSTFPLPILRTTFSARDAFSDEWASAIFGIAIVLDFRIPTFMAQFPPYYFAPTSAAIFRVVSEMYSALVPLREVPTTTSALNVDSDDSFFIPDPLTVVARESTNLKDGIKKELELLSHFRMGGEAKLNMKMDALSKWGQYKDFFPFLYPVATFVLSVPPGSVEVERFFSTARTHSNYNQASLLPTTFENRLMIAYNYKHCRGELLSAIQPSNS